MDTDQRITNVEEKIAYLENTVADLDEVIRALNDELAQLRRENKRMHSQIIEQREVISQMTPARDLIDDKPPHY